MADNTGIEWCDASWNPIRGCSKVSEGCRFCYAMGFAARFSGPGQPYEGLARMRNGQPEWTGQVRVVEEHLTDPLRWKRPRRIFVNSMSDLFHEKLNDMHIARIFAVMAIAEQHTFQVLTKRPERMAALLSRERFWEHVHDIAEADHGIVWDGRGSNPDNYHDALGGGLTKAQLAMRHAWRGPPLLGPLPNIWLGTSVENQAAADQRIPHLLRTPAAVRFISAEPLLGPVDLRDVRYDHIVTINALTGVSTAPFGTTEKCAALAWVICGGESGHGARPMEVAWAESIVKQCREANVACFVKQLGARPVVYSGSANIDGMTPMRLKDSKGGDPQEWGPELRVRQFPETPPGAR